MEKIKGSNEVFITFIKKHASVARFLFIGSLNTFIDLSLFALVANVLNVYAVIASIISTGVTLVFSFFMNHYFVFKSQKKKRQTALKFILITLINVWLIQSSVIFIVLNLFESVNFFETHQWTFNMFAKVCGISVSLVLNYLSYRKIFREDRGDK